MNKVKVIFDNNSAISWSNKNSLSFSNIFCKNVFDLIEFIKRNKIMERVQICLTDTSYKEGVRALQRRLIEKYSNAQKLDEELGSILKIRSIKNYPAAFLKAKIKSQFRSKIKETGIHILPAPKVSLGLITQRSDDLIPPFEEEDKGFRDTLIWLSIIDDAKINKDYKYVLVTNDGIFFDANLPREFMEVTKKEIRIIRPESLEECIDTELHLGIGLEKVREHVMNKIQGDKDFQNTLKDRGLQEVSEESSPFAATFTHFSTYSSDWKSRVVNLIFKSVDIDVKDKIKEGVFRIEAKVLFGALYSGSSSSKNSREQTNFLNSDPGTVFINQDAFSFNNRFAYNSDISNKNPAVLSQKFTLSYNQKKDEIGIDEVGEVNPSLGYLW
ncbi:MAG TPA: PIN domain-containing protein [Candidatus Paceibacterota bacterium]|jgi:hypothetical protein|nr:PIN domain-containing protein [Candidatus Paceibacterota bacterium]